MYENCKVCGPYTKPKDGSQTVDIIFPDGKKKRMSYPKYLLECKLNRQLTKNEWAWHIDKDPTNNNIDNLIVVTSEELGKLRKTSSEKTKGIKKVCPICNQEIAITNYKQHMRVCNGYGPVSNYSAKWDKYKNDDNTYTCPKCKRICPTVKSMSLHYASCVKGLNKHMLGKTKETDEVVRRQSESLKRHYQEHPEKIEHMRQINLARFSKDNPDREIEIEKARRGGLKSSQIRNVRSENETHFANLIIQLIGKDKVLLNEPMFNGFDADIIIPDIKLAILWNGAFHYKKCGETHDPEKAIERDNKKIELIKSYGYKVYVVKDLKSGKSKFVKEQFMIFVEKYYIDMIDKAKEIIDDDNTKDKWYKTKKMIEQSNIAKENYKKKRAKIISIIHKIRTSNIDFSKDGWLSKVAELTKINARFIHRWMKKYMPEFYKNENIKSTE